MELRTKLLLACFAVFVAIMAVLNYYDKVVLTDFTVFDYVSCDPSVSSCFVYCEEECAYDDPYAKIEKSGRNVPICNSALEECDELSCSPGEADCDVTYCSENELEPGEICHQTA